MFSKEGKPIGEGQHGNQEQRPFTAHDDYTRDGVNPYWHKHTDDCLTETGWSKSCPNHPSNVEEVETK